MLVSLTLYCPSFFSKHRALSYSLSIFQHNKVSLWVIGTLAMKTFNSLKVLVVLISSTSWFWQELPWLAGWLRVWSHVTLFLSQAVAVLWPVSVPNNLWSGTVRPAPVTLRPCPPPHPSHRAQGCAQTCIASRRPKQYSQGMIPAVVFILMHSE